jgi:hypothetical protein
MNNKIITDDAISIKEYIEHTWGKLFQVQLEVKLNKIFSEPENTGLKHIWKYGSADVVVYRDGKPHAIIEVGGSHHWEEKQSLNDRRKWKLADINNVRGINMMNQLMSSVSKRKFRAMLGSVLFSRELV